ncbi:MAG: peptidoglycan-binding protein [Candidatus Colwellbacteria bacterium]|nr:peptidoglycan-binding protein [Candidatus Colwellbacteria bacterium]
MSKTIKKVSAVSLSLTTAVWLSGAVLIMPVVASAATVEELQAQIASLLAQIQALQTQLTQTSGAAAAPSYSYTRDLTVGSKGDDVTALQNFLISQSSANWPAGQAATGYFGPITQSALGKYQAAVGISPTAGYFGPKTRAYLASVAVATPTTPTSPTTPTTPAVPSGNALAVAIASDSPSARTIGSGTAFNPGLKLMLTAGSAAVSVNGITLKKDGFLTNTNLNGVDVVVDGVRHGNVVTSVSADNTVTILMSSDPITVPAGQTKTVTVRFNLLTGNYTGTVSLGVNAASDEHCQRRKLFGFNHFGCFNCDRFVNA